MVGGGVSDILGVISFKRFLDTSLPVSSVYNLHGIILPTSVVLRNISASKVPSIHISLNVSVTSLARVGGIPSNVHNTD